MKKKDRQRYEKARKWWEHKGQLWQSAAETAAPEETLPAWPIKREFSSFEALTKKAAEVAAILDAGGNV